MGESKIIITWPITVILCVLIIAFTVLAFAGVISKEFVATGLTHLGAFLVGLALPGQPIATRWRTMYSMHPPPQSVVSDRPNPEE